MPALAADIAAGTRPQQLEGWSNTAIRSRYPAARDGSAQPAEGFFHDAANAVTAITQRGALLGVERRRFSVVVQELLWLSPNIGVPTVTLIDPEQGVSSLAMVSRMEVNPEMEQTLFEVMV